jgi:aldehyde dehydrogenase (NAD+)
MTLFETRLFINNKVSHQLISHPGYSNKLTFLIKYVDSTSGDRISVYNPVNHALVTSDVHAANKQDVDEAVNAAQAAFSSGPWRRFSATQRAECMFKLADLVKAKANELSELETIAMGQPISVALSVTDMLVSLFRCEYLTSFGPCAVESN